MGLGSGKNLFRIPEPGVKKASDPGSGSPTLTGGSVYALTGSAVTHQELSFLTNCYRQYDSIQLFRLIFP
jgi:hypothetical protein